MTDLERLQEDRRQERRVLTFFAVLAAAIILTLAHGLYTGEMRFHMGKGCVEEHCEPEQ
jgi:hypothetical protein